MGSLAQYGNAPSYRFSVMESPITPWQRLPSTFRKTVWIMGTISLLVMIGLSRFVWLSVSFDPSEQLSFPDKVVVYSGHAMMVGGGFVAGYSEVAQEALYLHIPGPDRRHWRSNFPAQSPLVQEHMEKLRKKIARGKSQASTRVVWHHYTEANQRWGLALNALRIIAERANGRIRYRGIVECSYPEDALITLPTGLGVGIPLNEGLYRSLEEAGWLHPYNAVWHWSKPI